MTLTSDRSHLDGRVAAADLDRALGLLHEAERARSEAVGLLAGLQHTELERFHGYVSWERLVAHQAGCGRDARRLLLVARHLDRFLLTAAALESGVINAAAVAVLAQAAVGLADAYEESETDLLVVAERCEVAELERVCRLWRDRADDEAAAADAEHRFDQRGVWIQPAFDGSSRLRQLADVALPALSPGINDPTTAQDAIFHIAAVLTELLQRDPPPIVREGVDKHPGRRSATTHPR